MGRQYEDETVRHDPVGFTLVRRRPALHWEDASGTTQIRELRGRVVVGSAERADVRLADATVSRLHAELEVGDSGTVIRDLDSLNGTFVSGIRVMGALITDNVRLRLGGSVLELVYRGASDSVDLWPESHFGGLVGATTKMRELFSQLDKVARSSAPVLIQGETGTGKELAARAIHEASGRAHEPFIVVDCGALPENLVEAELFGHCRGAFTGAVQNRCGAFEAAHGGTIFLDEIGELPLAVQPKLLRVLESGTVRRIGETSGRSVDVRVIGATHRNLARMVGAGAFREDLYFRLAVLPMTLPPLRERPEDIPLLVHRFLDGRAVEGLEVDELVRRSWLGNVRELRNLVERACTLGAREAMDAAIAMAADGDPDPRRMASPVSFDLDYREFKERWGDWGEREYIQELLKRHDYNVAQAARSAGINRTYLYRLLKKHAL